MIACRCGVCGEAAASQFIDKSFASRMCSQCLTDFQIKTGHPEKGTPEFYMDLQDGSRITGEALTAWILLSRLAS